MVHICLETYSQKVVPVHATRWSHAWHFMAKNAPCWYVVPAVRASSATPYSALHSVRVGAVRSAPGWARAAARRGPWRRALRVASRPRAHRAWRVAAQGTRKRIAVGHTVRIDKRAWPNEGPGVIRLQRLPYRGINTDCPEPGAVVHPGPPLGAAPCAGTSRPPLPYVAMCLGAKAS